jgi:hypothetical protein
MLGERDQRHQRAQQFTRGRALYRGRRPDADGQERGGPAQVSAASTKWRRRSTRCFVSPLVLQAHRMSADESHTKLDSKIRDLETKVTKLESNIQDVQQFLTELQGRLHPDQTKLLSEIGDLKTELIKLQSEATKLESEGTKLQSEATKLQSEAREVKTKVQSGLRDFWDVQVKAANYLMIAHAAGLVTCVTLLKDYKDSAQLKGIGLFVGLFGYGLIAAITAFVLLISQRLSLFRRDVNGDVEVKTVFRDIRLATAVCCISSAILVAAIVVAILKFGSL